MAWKIFKEGIFFDTLNFLSPLVCPKIPPPLSFGCIIINLHKKYQPSSKKNSANILKNPTGTHNHDEQMENRSFTTTDY